MLSVTVYDSDDAEWQRAVFAWAYKRRTIIGPIVAAVLALAALVTTAVYFLMPTDLERAEAIRAKAWTVISRLEEEALECRDEARTHREKMAKFQEGLRNKSQADDPEWFDWMQAMVARLSRLIDARYARRDALLHLAAEYRRLLTEADCEILRAKDFRDRGTPYKIAPRVREILAPVFGSD